MEKTTTPETAPSIAFPRLKAAVAASPPRPVHLLEDPDETKDMEEEQTRLPPVVLMSGLKPEVSGASA